MENEGQYTPLPQQGVPEQQQQYYGWQYEQQDQYAPVAPPGPAVPPPSLPPMQGLPSTPPAQAQFQSLRSYSMPSGPLSVPAGPLGQQPPFPVSSGALSIPSGPLEQQPPLPPAYQEPLLDMGSSLGYGQGMEYQYFNAPQPSQPLPVLRQTRLQQLRAERMRRQQGGQSAKPASPLSQLFHTPAAPPQPPPGSMSQGIPWGQQQPVLPAQMNGPQIGAAPQGTPWGPPQSEWPAQPEMTWEYSQSAAQPEAPSSPVANAGLPASPLLPRGPSGLLSLPSKPLPAVNIAAGEMVTRKQDTGAMQKVNMARATMILTGSFIVGRILGLLRTSLFAFVFGTTVTSDAYLQAFLIPDLIFNVVAGGALSSAFIPVFTHYMLGEKDEKTAWRVASSALNLALAVMCLLALLAIILAPELVPLYTPHVRASEMSLIVSLTRIMLLQSIIMGGGVIINSVLYARQNFLQPAIGTVLYNVGLIVGLLPGFFLTFAGRTEAHTTFAVYAATIGVVLGAALQVGVQIPAVVKERMRYTFTFDWKHPGVRQIGRQMLPRVLNATMLYFSTFVDRALILVLIVGPLLSQGQGLITQYYQALQLVLLPLGIFGMAISTAAFPTMAENVTLGRLDRVRAIIEDTLRSILFMSLPASVGLVVLGLPIIQVLLQHGAFSLDSATSTAVPLAFFALGLAGLACVEILTRSFYAFRDSKTPVIVSIAQFVFKILLSLLLLNIIHGSPSWGLGSLAFATSAAGLLEAAVLLYLLQKKIGMLGLRKLASFAGRVLLASLAMGMFLLLLRTFLDMVMITTASQSLGVLGTIFAVFKLVVELATGVLVYIWATRQFGIEDFWRQGPVRRVLERFKLSWI